MENTVIRFEVYEDNGGFVRCYLIHGDTIRGFDNWERFDFGDLRRCIYNALAGQFDRVEDSFDGVEFEDDVASALADDKDRSGLIVTAHITEEGASRVDVATADMGPAGRHAWGIKEED